MIDLSDGLSSDLVTSAKRARSSDKIVQFIQRPDGDTELRAYIIAPTLLSSQM